MWKAESTLTFAGSVNKEPEAIVSLSVVGDSGVLGPLMGCRAKLIESSNATYFFQPCNKSIPSLKELGMEDTGHLRMRKRMRCEPVSDLHKLVSRIEPNQISK